MSWSHSEVGLEPENGPQVKRCPQSPIDGKRLLRLPDQFYGLADINNHQASMTLSLDGNTGS
jgi:hypothetical protein